jgi:hypothetical protein
MVSPFTSARGLEILKGKIMKLRVLKNTFLHSKPLVANDEVECTLQDARELCRANKAVAIDESGNPLKIGDVFPPAPLPAGPLGGSVSPY